MVRMGFDNFDGRAASMSSESAQAWSQLMTTMILGTAHSVISSPVTTVQLVISNWP
jgi:hypothetical protein